MRRLVWTAFCLALGAAAGLGLAVWAYRRFDAAKRAVSPGGIVQRLDQAVQAAGAFAEQARRAAAEREAELRRALLKTTDDRVTG
ncbi:MAG: hypothetical protein LBD70_08005 [Bifidobacteriaceae bacterium]|jgi:uncharacterized iron-regulated membrane protein|nr:hypothetical protein [Bifidobacteriaceae bacterium]